MDRKKEQKRKFRLRPGMGGDVGVSDRTGPLGMELGLQGALWVSGWRAEASLSLNRERTDGERTHLWLALGHLPIHVLNNLNVVPGCRLSQGPLALLTPHVLTLPSSHSWVACVKHFALSRQALLCDFGYDPSPPWASVS